MPSQCAGLPRASSSRSRTPAATPSATRWRPPITPSPQPPPPVRPAASTTRLRACPWCPLRSGPAQARCSGRAPATCARTATRLSTRSTTNSARSAPRSTGPSATPAPTSPVGAPCSPVAAPRSACTSRCDCSATVPTRPSPPAFRTTPCAASPRCPIVPTGCTGYASWASTCATPLRSSRSRTPWRHRARWTS